MLESYYSTKNCSLAIVSVLIKIFIIPNLQLKTILLKKQFLY